MHFSKCSTIIRSCDAILLAMIIIVAIISSVSMITPTVKARPYKHSREELALTHRAPLIGQPDCGRNETPILVHTPAHSSGKYHARRMTIRRTWALEAPKYGMRVIFVVGVPLEPLERRAIKLESAQYKDILQFDFTESYYNLTIKNIAELRWASEHCGLARYLLKLDDDVVLNVPLFARRIARGDIQSGLTGEEIISPVYRDPSHKWYMPPEVYPASGYQMIRGFGYIISIDQLKPIVDQFDAYRGEIMDIDDLFLTSVILDGAGVARHNNSDQFTHYCGLDHCAMDRILVMHGCSDSRDSEAMYRKWKSSNVAECKFANLRAIHGARKIANAKSIIRTSLSPSHRLAPSQQQQPYQQQEQQQEVIRISVPTNSQYNRNGEPTPRTLIPRSSSIAINQVLYSFDSLPYILFYLP